MEGAKKGSFWSSTATMITAVGTLLAGLAAVATFLASQWLFAGSPTDDQEGPGTNNAQGQRYDEQTLWEEPKKLLLSVASDVDLDMPAGPVRDPEGVSGDIYMWLGETISAPSDMVKWTGQGDPRQKDCADLVASHGTPDHLVFNEGDRFCVRTSVGRIALLRALSPTANGWEFEATVWKQRLTAG